MVTKIILVRHGETEWNAQGRFQGWSETALLPKGEEQAKLLAKHFPVQELDAIYSSDLNRAHKTAQAVAERYKLTVQTDKKLREIHFGDWEGETFAQVNKQYDQAMVRFFNDPLAVEIPNGETFLELQQRAMEAIKRIIAQNAGKTVGVFAHGGTNKAILAAILQMPTKIGWQINQSNTAYNIFTYDDEHQSYYIYTINNTSHLPRNEQ